MSNSEMSAGTNAEQSNEADVPTSSQTIAKPNVSRSLLIRELTNKMAWWGIDMAQYEVEEIEFDEGSGRISWLHKANNKKLPYAERRLQCSPFYYDEEGEVYQYENPLLD